MPTLTLGKPPRRPLGLPDKGQRFIDLTAKPKPPAKPAKATKATPAPQAAAPAPKVQQASNKTPEELARKRANVAAEKKAMADGRKRRAARRREANAIAEARISILCERFPAVFNLAAPLPLALGTGKQIADLMGWQRHQLNPTMRWWCSRWKYYEAVLADGSMRHTLQGEPVDPVSDEHRQAARAGLNGLRCNLEQGLAAYERRKRKALDAAEAFEQGLAAYEQRKAAAKARQAEAKRVKADA